ncbi:MAG: T9SS type A sorting domain-containing protein [Candidatus Cloacimonetes bacterium]|jgi:YVTN family beta-propeller protein|nr:T9SS type A sorting domain-containing protein [Candidatus Cloacimonadota bacterium]MBT6994919.1 T9SS type A sorting domain-containing protein [Candidatus Cloacimonadota bacterium]MBT7469270.1 T9SS type A sorting domain-containing protein [Candidatus Cloacimonadota bacterium]
MKKIFLLVIFGVVSLAWGSAAFVVNSNSQTLSKIDVETGVVDNAFAVIGLYANRVVVDDDFAYVVNSGDNAIQKINLETGGTVANIAMPAYSNPYDMIIENGFGYVTGLFSASVSKINLATDEVVASVTVESSPEGMAIANGNLYVANTNLVWPNYGQGTISVVNLATFEVTTTINVEMNPQAMVVVDDKIHVVCTGDYDVNIGKVCVIDVTSNTVENTLEIGGTPANITLAPNGNVYLGDGMGMGVYAYHSETLEITHSAENMFAVGGASIATTEDKIAVVDAGDWVSNSMVRIYAMNEEFITEYEVAVGAVHIAFDTENSSTDNYALEVMNYKLNNYPNPFNPSTTISFSLTTNLHEKARIEIFNIKGQKVKTLSNLQITNSTNQQIIWNANNFASGVYFYKLVVDDKTVDTKKMILLK